MAQRPGSVHAQAMTLTPEQIGQEIGAWIRRGSPDARAAFASKMRRIRLSNGTWVTHDEEPGWLRIDGARCYSAAWL